MSTQEKNKKIAAQVLEAVGGRSNVSALIHCATRLRFTLIDESKANTEQCKAINGVITVVQKGGMYQVVIGNNVGDVFKEINAIAGIGEVSSASASNAPKPQQEGNIFKRGLNNFIQAIAGSIMPVIWVMMAGGLIKGIVSIINLTPWLTTMVGTGDAAVPMYQSGVDTVMVLSAMGDAAIYFLPIMLGFSAGKKFGGSPFLCATIGAVLVYPNMIAAAGAFGDGHIYLYGIKIPLMNYGSSVLPILVASYFSCKLEIYLMKKIPDVCKKFVVPGICILVVGSLTIMIVGPIMTWIADGLANGFAKLQESKGGAIVGGALVGGLWQVLVIAGMHLAFVPIMILNLTKNGWDALAVYAGIAAMSQTGAAFGLFLKMRNKETKAATFGQVVSGLCGITEPIIYGTTLPRRMPFVYGVIGGVVGGVTSAIIGGAGYSMGAFGVFAAPSWISPDGIGAGFWGALIGLVVAFVVPTIICIIFWKDDTMNKPEEQVASSVSNTANTVANNVANVFESQSKIATDSIPNMLTLVSPLSGVVKPLSQSADPVFASEGMGQGIVIDPTEGKLYSPCDGTIAMLFDTKHAIGIEGINGVSVLMHIGIDTVELNGQHFETHVTQGDTVKQGQLLISFDIAKINEAGYKTETPLIISNTRKYTNVNIEVSSGDIKSGEDIIEIS